MFRLQRDPDDSARKTMALVLKNPDGTFASKCALCGEVLSHPIFATGRFITNKFDEFYRFSDAAMHWNCYVRWPPQSRFAWLDFEVALNRRELAGSQNWKTLLKSLDAFVAYDFAMNEVSVMPAEVPVTLRATNHP
jgi:hypothetical protein